LDQERAGRVEHLPFAEGEILVGLEEVEIPQDLRDLEDRTGLDLLHVLAVAAVPSGRVDGDLLLTKDAVDPLDRLIVDDLSEAHGPDLVDRDQDLHSVLENAKHVEGLALARHFLVLDPQDLAHTLSRVDRLVTDLEGRLHSAKPPLAARPYRPITNG